MTGISGFFTGCSIILGVIMSAIGLAQGNFHGSVIALGAGLIFGLTSISTAILSKK